MHALVEHEPFEGYLRALLVSGSQSLGIALSTISIEDAELIRVYDWLVEHGDLLSRAGAIEAGILRGERSEPVKDALTRDSFHTMVSPQPASMVDP